MKILKDYDYRKLPPDEVQKTHYDPVAEAYGILVKAYKDPESTTADFTIAIDRALGFLGEALAE